MECGPRDKEVQIFHMESLLGASKRILEVLAIEGVGRILIHLGVPILLCEEHWSACGSAVRGCHVDSWSCHLLVDHVLIGVTVGVSCSNESLHSPLLGHGKRQFKVLSDLFHHFRRGDRFFCDHVVKDQNVIVSTCP